MPVVYLMNFELRPKPGYAPEEALLASLQEWVSRRCPDARTIRLDEPFTETTTNNSILRWEPFQSGDSLLAEFAWRHPHIDAPHVTWGTTVSYLRSGARLRLSVRVANTGPDIGQTGALLTTRPRLLVHLGGFFIIQSTDGPCTLACEVLTASDLPRVVHWELMWHERTRPVLLLTPKEDGSYVVRPDQLGEEFLSLAKVYAVQHPNDTFVLTDQLRRRVLSCFRGAARIYLPGLDYGADPMKHPLLLPHALSDSERRMKVAQFLAASTVGRFKEDQQLVDTRNHLRDLRAAAYSFQQRERILGLEKRAADNVEGSWSSLVGENERLLADNDDLRRRLAEAEARSEHLEADKRALIYQLRAASAQEGIPEALALPEPYDNAEAVEIAGEMFDDGLLVLPSAAEAAAKSPYRFPQRVLETLQILADAARLRAGGNVDMPLKEVFRQKNVDYRAGIAGSTSDRHRSQYEFSYGGQTYVCEEHVCLGGGYDPASNLRIYFTTRHKGEGRFVVGYVGRHLEGRSSS
jgi:regulator of replication initiation timing